MSDELTEREDYLTGLIYLAKTPNGLRLSSRPSRQKKTVGSDGRVGRKIDGKKDGESTAAAVGGEEKKNGRK